MTKTCPFPVDPAKVLLAGDWHGNIRRAEAVIEIAGRKGITVIIHLGDFGFWVPGTGNGRVPRAREQLLQEVRHHATVGGRKP